MTALADAFGVGGEETLAVVGAGGKKTTLYALADRLDRAVVTATVRIPIFDDEVAAVRVTPDPASAVRDATAWPLGLVPEREREDRYLGYDPAAVDALADAHDGPVLVKADGARTRLLKAPDEREPQLPDADVVVPVASVKAVGRPLDEAAVHRPERVAAITGLDGGDEIRPSDVAAVLASDRGGRKAVGDARVVPLVNMVDDEALESTAREIARGVHDRADIDRVVLAQMDVPAVVATV